MKALKESTSMSVSEHVNKFSTKLLDLQKDVESFKRKDLATLEEMKTNVETLAKINERLEAASVEMEQLNTEQKLLEMEQTQFPLLNEMFKMKEPYERLWNTTLTFTLKASSRLSLSLFIRYWRVSSICITYRGWIYSIDYLQRLHSLHRLHRPSDSIRSMYYMCAERPECY